MLYAFTTPMPELHDTQYFICSATVIYHNMTAYPTQHPYIIRCSFQTMSELYYTNNTDAARNIAKDHPQKLQLALSDHHQVQRSSATIT